MALVLFIFTLHTLYDGLCAKYGVLLVAITCGNKFKRVSINRPKEDDLQVFPSILPGGVRIQEKPSRRNCINIRAVWVYSVLV